MPKISKYEHGATDAEMVDHPPVPIRRAEIQGNGGASSAGNSSAQLSVNDATSSASEKASPQPPAPTTENPSNPPEPENSSAHSTGGSTPKTQPPRSGKKVAKKAPAKKAQSRKSAGVRSTGTDDEDDW